MTTPDLERLARETAAVISGAVLEAFSRTVPNWNKKDRARAGEMEALFTSLILTALRTAQSATANEDTARMDWVLGHVARFVDIFETTQTNTALLRAAIDQARREGK